MRSAGASPPPAMAASTLFASLRSMGHPERFHCALERIEANVLAGLSPRDDLVRPGFRIGGWLAHLVSDLAQLRNGLALDARRALDVGGGGGVGDALRR